MRDKGKYGEYLIWKALQDMEIEGATFLFNLYLPRDEKRTTEIDVLMLAPQGIFVFESKNYSGWIFGDERSRFWTQTLPTGKRAQKERFLNPILQNAVHIRCLKKIIGNEAPVFSIIVFSERCELKRLEVDMSGTVQVVKRDRLRNVVKGIEWGQNLSSQQLDKLYNELFPYSQVSMDVKQAHIQAIEEQLKGESGEVEVDSKPVENRIETPLATRTPGFGLEKQHDGALTEPEKQREAPEPTICPQCGGVLVLRIAKRGSNTGNQFYGCSNYPRCRYTKNMAEQLKREEKGSVPNSV